MSDRKEQRRDPRVPLVLQVAYPDATGVVRDATENLSAGGMFIRTERELSPGDRLPLEIAFPGLLEPLAIEVEVVRRRPAGAAGPAGVAAKIPPDRRGDRNALARLADHARLVGGEEALGYRVLVVEDNPHVVATYEHAIRKLGPGAAGAGVGVEYAANGQEALERLAGSPPVQLVLTDLYMPVMDGFTLIERIRGDAALEKLPILVVSAGGADARARAVELGADVYLQKPAPFADVIATVGALLHLRA